MAERLMVVKLKVYPTGQPNDLGVRDGTTNFYNPAAKITNLKKRCATFVADASIAAIGTAIDTAFTNAGAVRFP